MTRHRRRKLRRAYTVLRCPFAGHRVTWCRQLCQPIAGRGVCGRFAPHGLVGRTQRAIARHAARQQAAAASSEG